MVKTIKEVLEADLENRKKSLTAGEKVRDTLGFFIPRAVDEMNVLKEVLSSLGFDIANLELSEEDEIDFLTLVKNTLTAQHYNEGTGLTKASLTPQVLEGFLKGFALGYSRKVLRVTDH